MREGVAGYVRWYSQVSFREVTLARNAHPGLADEDMDRALSWNQCRRTSETADEGTGERVGEAPFLRREDLHPKRQRGL